MYCTNAGLLFFLSFTVAAAGYSQSGAEASFATVQAIFNSHCISCHGGDEPVLGMSLEAGHSYRNLVNHISSEDETLRRVAPNNVDGSYLYRKIARKPEELPYKEDAMPLDAEPLSQSDIESIATWINSFPRELWGQTGSSSERSTFAVAPEKDDFLATQLINLPTSRTLGSRTAEFRILHRFGVMNGGGHATLQTFFGLDNGAMTSINLSIALRDNLDLLIRRTGYHKDVEMAFKYVPWRQKEGWPVTVGCYAAFDWISRQDVAASNRLSPTLQLLLASRVRPNWSLLLAPSWALRSNHEKIIRRTDGRTYSDTRSTTAIGFGSEYRVRKNTALVAEYVARIQGYRGNTFAGDRRYNTWSIGVAHRIRLHVFEVLISNNQHLHTTQYLPGSATVSSGKLFDNGPNVHFGFNIIRQFKW